jgi:ribonuclease P protein component
MEKPVNKKVDKIKVTFKKGERLCSKKIIDKLFADGSSFLSYPVKTVYLRGDLPTDFPVQAAFSVSKKNYKRALERNIIKRRMRESYRTNKHSLYKNCDGQLAVFFIYVGKEILDYQKVEAGMKKALVRLQNEMEKINGNG